MPCCMLGAMFLGQCLGVWAWIRRRLGFGEQARPQRCDILGVLRCRPKTVLFVMGLELVFGGAVLAYTGQELHEHAGHQSSALQSFQQLRKEAICGAEKGSKPTSSI